MDGYPIIYFTIGKFSIHKEYYLEQILSSLFSSTWLLS